MESNRSMSDDETTEAEDTTPTEGSRAWRERMQQTNELAEQLQPPHNPDDERGDPSPSRPA
jgi:hypothetical protein